MLSLLFTTLAGICNAVMDTCKDHYITSVFHKYKTVWWNAEWSWLNKYVDYYGDKLKNIEPRRVKWWKFNKPVQLTDAWHFFKMLWIVFMVLAIVSYDSVIPFNWEYTIPQINWQYTFLKIKWEYIFQQKTHHFYYWDLLLFGINYNSFFRLFYKKIFIKKHV